MKSVLVVIALVVLVIIGGAVFIGSGVYNVAATDPHWDITYTILEEVRERSIANHSKGIQVPPLEDPGLKEAGFHEFDEMCVRCHGAPGYGREEFAMGLYPSPPDLAQEDISKEREDAKAFWVIKNGLKMTGMPSFGVTHEDNELWGIVAFLKGLNKMTPEDYKAMVEAEAETGHEHEDEGHHHAPHHQ